MRKKLVPGYWRGRWAIRLSDSWAPGSRLTITSCGASGRPSSADSPSAAGSCASTFTPNPLRKFASSCRFEGSASTVTQFSWTYMSNLSQ